MPKITIIFLLIQYIVLWVLRTADKVDFWMLDLFIHILFVIQSIAALWILFFYINSKSKVSSSNKIQDLIRVLNNLIIFLWLFILLWNIIIFYWIEKLKDIF